MSCVRMTAVNENLRMEAVDDLMQKMFDSV